MSSSHISLPPLVPIVGSPQSSEHPSLSSSSCFGSIGASFSSTSSLPSLVTQPAFVSRAFGNGINLATGAGTGNACGLDLGMLNGGEQWQGILSHLDQYVAQLLSQNKKHSVVVGAWSDRCATLEEEVRTLCGQLDAKTSITTTTKTNSSSSFAVALIDLEHCLFHKSLWRLGAEGGFKAVDAFKEHIASFVGAWGSEFTSPSSTLAVKQAPAGDNLMVFLFCNRKGLAARLQSMGFVSSAKEAEMFTNALVDAGGDKWLLVQGGGDVGSRITSMATFYSRLSECRQIFVSPVQEQQGKICHPSDLCDLIRSASPSSAQLAEKLSLLRVHGIGEDDGPVGARYCEFPGLFDSGPPSRTTSIGSSGDEARLSMTIKSGGTSTSPPTSGSSASWSQEQSKAWAKIGGGLPAPGTQRAASSSPTASRRTSTDFIGKKKSEEWTTSQPYLQHHKSASAGDSSKLAQRDRVDPTKPMSKQDPPPCNSFYLNGHCVVHQCRFSHTYALSPENMEEMRRGAAFHLCYNLKNHGHCPDGDACVYGHVCPKGRNCPRIDCRFNEEQHPVGSPNTTRTTRRK